MIKEFDDWFENLRLTLLDENIQFNDRESVREDFEAGRDLFEVADEIRAEYE